MIYGIILAGGRGERFWPLSRTDKPKQFLKLTSDRTMLEETIARVEPFIPKDRLKIVTGEHMGELILSSSTSLGPEHILSEPVGRNTCLAIGLAAIHLVKEDKEAVMVVLSSDHLIKPAEKLIRIIKDGCAIATSTKALITIGVVANRPETGYGYIKMGEEHNNNCESSIFKVAGFTEKPKAVVAQEYYYSRKYLWNSGMFIWRADEILHQIELQQPEMYKQLLTYSESIGTPDEVNAKKTLYDEATSISVDYAILEKADNVLTMKADIIWDDVGSWSALERYKKIDSDNNVIIGETVSLESYETTIYNDSEGIIATLGVSDLVIVRSRDITLVAHKAKLGQIKELLAKIGEDEKTIKYL